MRSVSSCLFLGAAAVTHGLVLTHARGAYSSVPSRHVVPQLGIQGLKDDLPPLKTPATVQEAEEAFYAAMTPYINSGPVQAFSNNMIQLNQFAIIAPTWKYSRIWAVGFMALCDTFLETCRTEENKVLTTAALLYGLGMDVAEVQADAEALKAACAGKTEAELMELDDFRHIKDAKRFIYTYTFGSGLLTLMPAAGVTPSNEAIDRWCSSLNLSMNESLKRDYAYFRSSIEKYEQIKELQVMMAAQSKKNEAEYLKKKAEEAAKEADAAEAAIAS
jgi:hypothetical protein